MEVVDRLYDESKFGECRVALENMFRTNKDPEVAWRLARCYYLILHGAPEKPSSASIKELMTAAQTCLVESLKNHPGNSMAFTWLGIAIDQLAQLGGIKDRIQKSYEMRENFEKALELDPKNSLAHSAMGTWCFTVADLPEVKRKLAATFFAKPPKSTFEEALTYLTKSEELSPKALCGNLYHLARTYKKLGDKQKAREYCQYTLEFQDIGSEVAEVSMRQTSLIDHTKKEARELLKKL
ncbi:hypothetical protein FBUS_10050 [Fasciolopsis buskii]|uniref:Regulator of microtubule dynamics protein 1 n=1 Tax=Fasciolopsis buskii TaxID=27845 RepID=A0A8E0VRF8_9TREM|nr:hypothetical protein FBUS_10050 [Fasciolopsis buski]